MTDAADLTPEQDAVRRLLAGARHDGSTPPEVVARLDDTLAALVEERGSAPRADAAGHRTSAPVVDLGARRRRTAGVALLAAAAVVVAGVAIGQGLPRMSGEDADAGSAADGATATSESQEPGGSDDSGGADAGGSAESQLAPNAKQPGSAVPNLSTSDTDLEQELIGLRPSAGARRGISTPEAPDASCLLGIGPGRRLAAEVDGQPGVIVYRPRSGNAQEVALFVCGDGKPVRTLVLPLP